MPEKAKITLPTIEATSTDLLDPMLADPVLLYVFKSQLEPPQVALFGSAPS